MIRRRVPLRRSSKPIPRRTRPRKVRKNRRPRKPNGALADKLWSELVRRRGSCEVCGKSSGVTLQAAHGFSRRYRGTRWLPINGFCLCAGCHVRYTYDPLGWTDWLKEAWGPPVYEELKRLAQKVAKPDFAVIVAALREELGNA